MQPDLQKGYDPREVESRWYQFWEEHDVFAATADPADKRPVYVCPMPPPNVTGSLHMGHAMRCTFEDALVRFHRMRGFNTLWQPGIDHAGIATQTVVERQIAREGKTRFDLGREAFEKRIWEWKGESGGRIALQQRILGSSAAWSRSKFTMDADMSVAVREAFVRLHEEGLMYTRHAAHQLGSDAPHFTLGPRGGSRGNQRRALRVRASRGRNGRRDRGRHHPARDHAR